MTALPDQMSLLDAMRAPPIIEPVCGALFFTEGEA